MLPFRRLRLALVLAEVAGAAACGGGTIIQAGSGADDKTDVDGAIAQYPDFTRINPYLANYAARGLDSRKR